MIQNIFFAIVYFLSISFIFSGCTEDKIVPEEKYIDVYTDLVIAQDTSRTNSADQRDSIQQMIFKRYNINSAEYSATINYYSQNPAKWEIFFNAAIDSLEARKQRGGK